MIFGSTRVHGVWMRLVNPRRGPAPPTEIQIFTWVPGTLLGSMVREYREARRFVEEVFR